jgi:hypothetical protein
LPASSRNSTTTTPITMQGRQNHFPRWDQWALLSQAGSTSLLSQFQLRKSGSSLRLWNEQICGSTRVEYFQRWWAAPIAIELIATRELGILTGHAHGFQSQTLDLPLTPR